VQCDESVTRATVADVAGDQVLFLDGEAWQFSSAEAGSRDKSAGSHGTITSPMPGRVVTLDVKTGDAVKEGQRLLVLEAMKMELGLVAPFDGTVVEVREEAGEQVVEGAPLLRIESTVRS
jgi:3-methylcrotonyl-CoA carboxylase alpha subunit